MDLRLLLTVIIPNFNSGDRLLQTVRSFGVASGQLELIIVDGQSTDGSLGNLSEEVSRKWVKYKVVSEPDRGVYDAMNKGIRLATGDFVYFIGAGDSVIAKDFYRAVSMLPLDTEALIYSDVMVPNGTIYDGSFGWRKLYRKNLCHQSAFYSRSIFERVGYYNLAYKAFADWDVNFRCFAERKIVKRYIPLVIASYEGGGLSDSGDRKFEQDKDLLFHRYFGEARWRALQALLLWEAVIGHATYWLTRLGKYCHSEKSQMRIRR